MRKIYIGLLCMVCLLISGCSSEFTNKETAVTEEDIVIDNSGLEILQLNHLVGNIKILLSDSDKVLIHTVKTTSAPTKSALAEKSEKVTVETHVNANQLTIETIDREQTKLFDLNVVADNSTIDYTIHIPDTIRVLSITNGVGDIQVAQLKASCNITSGVGNINLGEIQLTGDSHIELGTGNITLDLSIDDLQTLLVTSGVGNIDISMPKESQFRLNTDSGIGSTSGNLLHPPVDTEKDNHAPVATIEITTGLGDISVNGK